MSYGPRALSFASSLIKSVNSLKEGDSFSYKNSTFYVKEDEEKKR